MTKPNIFKKVYHFYSRDLTSHELERVIMKDTPMRYKYYINSMEKSRDQKNTLSEVIVFSKNLAIAFLEKLSPLIRIVYSAVILLFLLSFLQNNWKLAFFSFVLLNLLFVFEIADKLTARDELEVARDVQTGLIPLSFPDDNDFEISCHYETAREVGGDFIDFIQKDEDSYYIAIGDISGKGMSAALYMVQIKLLIRHLSESSEDPKDILISLNRNIFKHVRKGLYLSAILAEVKDKTFKICIAGHTPLLHYNSATRTCNEINQKGMALGLSEGDLFENSLEQFSIELNKNDVILFYSDGLTETMNHNKLEFGVEKVREILIGSSHKSAEEIRQDILTEVSKFRGYAEVHDDTTMILMKAV